MILTENSLDLIDVRASKGVPKDFVSSFSTSNQLDKQTMGIFLEMIRNDPICSSAMDITIETATSNGYNFYPKPGKEDEKFEKQAQEAKVYFEDVLDYDIVQDNVVANLFLYGDCPVEMRGNTQRKINELHILEMTELDIEYNENGEITKFIQQSGKGKIEWGPSDVMFIQSRQIGSKVRSYAPLESVAVNFATLMYANNHILQILKNMPPKLMYVLKNADKTTRAMFINNLRLSKTNPAVDLVANNEATIVSPEFNYNGLFDVLTYVRQQVLMVTRVPPVWVGLIDTKGADRGNSEAMISAFMSRIVKIQQRIASSINKDLLPKLGHKNIWFKYNPPSLKLEKEIIENAERLSNIGADQSVVARYLSERGIRVGKGQIVQENQTKDKDLMPSRTREDKTTDSMTSELNRDGTSDKSGKKIESRNIQQRWYI